MDWLIARIRLWLGIEAEMMVLRARVDALEAVFGGLDNRFGQEQRKIAENHRFAESLSNQIAQLRQVLTARPEPPKAIKAKSWREVQSLMQEEISA